MSVDTIHFHRLTIWIILFPMHRQRRLSSRFLTDEGHFSIAYFTSTFFYDRPEIIWAEPFWHQSILRNRMTLKWMKKRKKWKKARMILPVWRGMAARRGQTVHLVFRKLWRQWSAPLQSSQRIWGSLRDSQRYGRTLYIWTNGRWHHKKFSNFRWQNVSFRNGE